MNFPAGLPLAACHAMLGLLALLLPAVTAGQEIDVDRADLYLRGGRLPSGAWGCGFAILANHRTRDDPHVEWDISVEQVNNGSHIAVSVAAASYTVIHKSRHARAPPAQLSFVIDQDPQPVQVRFAAPAGTDGAVHGQLASDGCEPPVRGGGRRQLHHPAAGIPGPPTRVAALSLHARQQRACAGRLRGAVRAGAGRTGGHGQVKLG